MFGNLDRASYEGYWPGALHLDVSVYLRTDLVVKWPVIAEEAAKQRLWNADNQPSRPWP